MIRTTSENDDHREDQEPHDCYDLDGSEQEFRLAIDIHSKDVETEYKDNKYGDPYRRLHRGVITEFFLGGNA
jgi:hypothetical protein